MIKETKINYLCDSWQYFIQQLQSLINRGYYFYHVVELPIKKQEKWISIDEKLIEKYDMNKSKFQRSRNKGKGYSNFYYLRCESVGIILHTLGEISEDLVYDDKFEDIRKRHLTVKVSQNIELEISLKVNKQTKKKSYTVRFSNQCISDITTHLEETIKSTKNKYKICYEFNMLNGIPSYSGIVDQKVELAKWVVKCAKYHQVKLEYKDLRINTFRKVYGNNKGEDKQ